jgi:hypothetical protein
MSTSVPDDQTAEGTTASEGGAQEIDPREVVRQLAGSIALLPQQPPAEGEEAAPEGAIALPVIEQDGTQYIPVFTSEEALRAAGADPTTALRLPLAELAANWPDENLWLAVNPATENGLALPPEVVRSLAIIVPSGDQAAGQTAGQTAGQDAGQPASG